jgi:hypothetical protein
MASLQSQSLVDSPGVSPSSVSYDLIFCDKFSLFLSLFLIVSAVTGQLK